ncbi:hypothetical protein C8Q76DRAFT_10939 [Earliella scabrosa]|nr:hypothetical protein C8Q76DRAFT_10939 [Earliella scabrosa]
MVIYAHSSYELALGCRDILETIFDTLEGEHGLDSRGRGTCASASRVCHMFYDTASRTLWRSIPSLELWNLLHPIPAARDMNTYYNQLRTHKPYLHSSRWTRFLAAAARVQVIWAESRGPYEASLIQAVIEHNGGASFLPSLRKLRWDHSRHSGHLLFTLAPRCLPELIFTSSLKLSPSDTAGLNLFSAYASLRKVRLFRTKTDASFWLSQLVGLKQLRELLLTADEWLGPSEWKLLGTSLAWETLTAHVGGFPGPIPFRFPALRDLQSTGPLDQMLHLISSLRAPSLQVLRPAPQRNDQLSTTAICHELLDRISAFFPLQITGKKLLLTNDDKSCHQLGDRMHVFAPDRRVALGDVLHPSFTLIHLQELSVHIR